MHIARARSTTDHRVKRDGAWFVPILGPHFAAIRILVNVLLIF